MNVSTQQPDRTELRSFGLVMAVACLVIGSIHTGFRWVWYRQFEAPVVFLSVSLLFLLCALAAPQVLRPVFTFWMTLAAAIHWFMNHLILTLTYLTMFVPIRVVHRIAGRDFLKRAWLPEVESYWEEAEEQPDDLERYKYHY